MQHKVTITGAYYADLLCKLLITSKEKCWWKLTKLPVQQYTFSIPENSAHYLASWCLHLELQRVSRTSMLPLHRLLFGLKFVVMQPGLIVYYYVPYKQILVKLHEFQIFIWCFESKILHFLVKHLRDPSHTDFCHLQVFSQIILTELVQMPTVSGICCTLTQRFCKTIFYSTRVFITDS